MIAAASDDRRAEQDCLGMAEAIRQSMAMLAAIFAPEDWICFHAVGQYGGKRWGTLADDEIEPILEWVWRCNTRTQHKCQPFFGANARRGHGQDKAEGTAHAGTHFCDWEGVTAHQANELILAAGLPAPTAMMESGRGIHAYWRLHEAEENAGEWTHRQKWIAAAVRSDAAVSDWQRKMRLPGFFNVKDKYAPDYPLSRLVFAEPARRYSWRDLQPRHLPEPSRRPEPTAEQVAEVARLPPGSMSELSRRFVQEGHTLPGGRRVTGYTVACDLAARRWQVEAAVEAICTGMRRWLNRGPAPLTPADLDDVPRQVRQAFSKPRTPIIDGGGAVPVRVEHMEHDVGDSVPLGEYRERIAAAVKVAVRTKGVHLNTAGTGCGKTFATARAVASLARSVTSAPTHALCEERAAELRSFGVDAAAYPPLDEHTCENYDEARRVQAAGLSPGRVLCGSCPFRTSCEMSGYLARVKAADKARHKVVTHARLARSAKVVCKGAECIVLEEEPTAAVRPSIAASRQEMARAGDFAKVVYRRLRDDDESAVEVDLSEIGFSDPDYGLPTGDDAGFADFAAWSLPPESPAAKPQKESARDVVNGPRRRVRALMAKQLHKAAFFRHVADVARYLQVEAKAAMRKGSGVYVVPMPAPVKPPKNIDGIVWPSLAESSEPPAADALRLAVAAASGGLNTVVVQVDANERYAKSHPDAKPLLRARIIGLWQTALPYSRVPVVINDGTNDAVTVKAIVGREVNDITPPGRVPLQHSCVQYASDVTQGTRLQAVANIVCGIARAHADKPRLGVIMLKAHRDKLLPECLVHDVPRRGRKPAAILPMPIRHRVEWHTHFNSGLDRGSNDMHTQVDLALVIGTFRPPPSEVRRRLIEMGMVAEAHAGDEWGVIERHGWQPSGEPMVYQGRGYASEAWRLAAESLTRAAVRQAIGRARANTAAGVPVVAVTTENTGLPILPAKALPRSRREIERVVEAITCTPEHRCTTGAKSAIYIHSKSGTSCSLLVGCSLSSIRERLPTVPRRTLLRWINAAVESGAVIRKGRTTKTRYTLPAAPQPAKQEPPRSDGTCPSCGSDEHRDSVSRDGQIGRRCCAECGRFIAFTIWQGKPVPGQPPTPHQQATEPLVISSG
jgi:hypothetical protein